MMHLWVIMELPVHKPGVPSDSGQTRLTKLFEVELNFNQAYQERLVITE